jgi:hypothetical protein
MAHYKDIGSGEDPEGVARKKFNAFRQVMLAEFFGKWL